MLGGFYWVTYVIHEFGFLPWPISIALFAGFCGFGSLNFPLFVGVAGLFYKRLAISTSPLRNSLWHLLFLPALFAVTEHFVPRLFPWYLANCLTPIPLSFQVLELTGISFLSFLLVSTGGALTLIIGRFLDKEPFHNRLLLLPSLLWMLTLGFGAFRLYSDPGTQRSLNVLLVQANIGSIEKLEAEKGMLAKVEKVISRYRTLTDEALTKHPNANLIFWPETALPFYLDSSGKFQTEIKDAVTKWGKTLITGAYGRSLTQGPADYNAAFLLEPLSGSELRTDIYRKNIILAFGEYLPFGEWFPVLYRWFPQVSNFERGKTQHAFELRDGTKLGATICYEAIIPSFVRKVSKSGVHALFNLTNDSWFGPTSEPHHHGALAVFRSVEFRVPVIRVTNTGISFFVDALGRRSAETGVYQEGTLSHTIRIPSTPPKTLYLRYGDWFIGVCIVALLWIIFLWRRPHVSLPF